MKSKNTYMRGWYAIVMLAVFSGAVAARAQSPEQYVVSARAGGVNVASGDVSVRRRGASLQESLAQKDALDSGDAVRTGADGRVEVLLLPGSYLRLGENSEFEFVDTTLDSLRIKLVRGSAIVEAAGTDDTRSLLEVGTPQTTVRVDKRGLYRINVLPNNTTEVYVRKGRMLVENGAAAGAIKVEGGEWLTAGSGQSSVQKFDKHLDRDAFDTWSGQRARMLAAANKRLSERSVASSLNAFGRGGLGLMSRRSSGLWIYDPFFGGNTFLPFYYGLSSPYGHGYSRGFGFSTHDHFASIFSPHRHRRVIISPHPGSRDEHRRGTNHQSPGHIRSGRHRRDH